MSIKRRINLLLTDFIWFIKRNVLLFSIFIFFTIALLCQHALILTWDFSVYVLNAKYWAMQGNFFESPRPPLMPILLVIFSVFGWKISEYIFIVFSSALFFYSTIKLSDAIRAPRLFICLLSISVYLIKNAVFGGTELLSLAFLELFIAALICQKISGHYLALAILTRYTSSIFLPLLIFSKKKKLYLFNAIFFILPFIPWFFYNLKKYRHFLMSFGDSFALNVAFRNYVNNAFDISSIFSLGYLLIILAFIGILYILYRYIKRDIIINPRIFLIMILYTGLSLYQYINTPLKVDRYLFSIIPGIVFFAYFGVKFFGSLHEIKRKTIENIVIGIVFILNISIGLLFVTNIVFISNNIDEIQRINKGRFIDTIDIIREMDMDKCRISSNAWPHLNYYGITSDSSPWEELAEKRLKEGEIIVLFKKEGLYSESVMNNIEKAYEDENVVILREGNKCLPIRNVDDLYIHNRNKINIELYGEEVETEPCNIIFKNKILGIVCIRMNKILNNVFN